MSTSTLTPQPLDSDIDVLRVVPFFAGFSEEHLRLIASSAESRSLPEKLLLFDEGQLLHSAYVIISGTLKGEQRAKASAKIAKRDIGPGTILGERALILDTRAAESVRVETRTRVLQIRKLMFRRLLQEQPDIAVILRSRMTRQVVNIAAHFNVVADRLAAIHE